MTRPDDGALAQTLSVIERLIDHMTEAVMVINRDGRVIALNGAAVELLDLESREAGLRPVAQYDELITSWRTDDRESDAPTQLVRALEGDQLRDQRATITTAAGSERQVSFSSTSIYAANLVEFAMLTVQDRTEHERNERYWRAVGTAATRLTGSLDVDAVLQSAIDIMVEALGGEVVLGIWRLDEDTRRLELRVHRGISPESVTQLTSLPLDSESLICEAAAQRAVLFEERLAHTPPRHEFDRRLATRERLSSWITGPLVTDERLVGTMGYGLRAEQQLYTHETDAVAAIGGLLAVAIVHAELYQQSQLRGDALMAERDSRSRFTGAIAHDLRQPLTVIGGDARLLVRAGDLSREQREMVDDIGEQTLRLNRMAEDLTDAAQIEAGQFTISREWTDLADLVRRTVRRLDRLADAHQIRLIDAPDELEGDWDHDRLVQVMENLLRNAVKFSPGGGEIAVRVVPGEGEVVVSVRDAGVGIAPEDLPRLFQAFTRLASVHAVSGSGLGLYIARSIIEAHGGRVFAESAGPGHGATFSFGLPIAE